MSKKDLKETEICQNFITPAIARAGWDQYTQIRREFAFTAGRVIVRGKVADGDPTGGDRRRRGLVLATLLTRIEATLYLHSVSAAAGLKLVP